MAIVVSDSMLVAEKLLDSEKIIIPISNSSEERSAILNAAGFLRKEMNNNDKS